MHANPETRIPSLHYLALNRIQFGNEPHSYELDSTNAHVRRRIAAYDRAVDYGEEMGAVRALSQDSCRLLSGS